MHHAQTIFSARQPVTASLPLPTTPPANTTPVITTLKANRRLHHRFNVERPSKVFRRHTQSYIPARTRNLSVGGALLEISGPRLFEVGEIIDVGIAFKRDAMIHNHAMLQAIVMRIEHPTQDTQHVAIRYLNPHHLVAAA